MTAYLESLTEQTLSGRPYQRVNAVTNIELEKFISFLGEVYATTFVELFIDGAVDGGEKDLRALFDRVLTDVRLVETGGEIPIDVKTFRIPFSVWGLVKLDQLVNSLEKDGATLAAMWLFEKVVDARMEAIGDWVRVVDRKSFASAGGKKKYEEHRKAKDFVQTEWLTHKSSYAGNKSAFSRDYARRVSNEFAVKVTEKTIREVWLIDGLFVDEHHGRPELELDREDGNGA